MYVFQIRYYEDDDHDFYENEDGEWEFATYKEAKSVFDIAEKDTDLEWKFLEITRTPKLDEDDWDEDEDEDDDEDDWDEDEDDKDEDENEDEDEDDEDNEDDEDDEDSDGAHRSCSRQAFSSHRSRRA